MVADAALAVDPANTLNRSVLAQLVKQCLKVPSRACPWAVDRIDFEAHVDHTQVSRR
jgi:hypothetical protein